jgi:hypothetical protein
MFRGIQDIVVARKANALRLVSAERAPRIRKDDDWKLVLSSGYFPGWSQKAALPQPAGNHAQHLAYRLLNPLSFIAFKMGRLRGGPRRNGAKGAYLDRYVTDPAAAGKQPTHFQRNPPGRGQRG